MNKKSGFNLTAENLSFLFIMILVIGALIYVYKNPDYYKYDPTSIVISSDGSAKYIEYLNCERYNGFGKIMNCDINIRDPPYAYYLHNWLTENRSTIYWGILIYFIAIAIISRKGFKQLGNLINDKQTKNNKI